MKLQDEELKLIRARVARGIPKWEAPVFVESVVPKLLEDYAEIVRENDRLTRIVLARCKNED